VEIVDQKPMRASGIILILLGLNLPAFAQQGPGDRASGPATISRLETGNILSVEKHGEGRPFDWVRGGLALIPVYDRYAFYDITIQSGGKNYVVRYETQTGYYPAAWKPGNPIQYRPGHGRLYLLRYDGEEVPASTVHESSVRH
jgi:hypothetical protein